MSEKLRLSEDDLTRIARVHTFLLQEIPIKITTGIFAGIIGLNRNKLSYGFKKMYGVTMNEFEEKKRMEIARKLLSTSREPVDMIALWVGYHSNSHFVHLFQKRYQITPLQYRNKIQLKSTKSKAQTSRRPKTFKAHI